MAQSKAFKISSEGNNIIPIVVHKRLCIPLLHRRLFALFCSITAQSSQL